MYLLVTDPLAWPTKAAIVTSVKPRSLPMLAKLWRKHMRGDIGERRVPEDLLPVVGEAAERVVVAVSRGRHRCRYAVFRRSSRNSTTGRPIGRIEVPSLLSIRRRQLASVSASVHIRPDHLAPAAAGQRDLTDDLDRHGVLLVLLRPRAAFAPSVRYSASVSRRLADIVFRLPQTMGRIGGDDAGFDRVGENAAEEPDGSRRCSGAASDDGLAAQLLRLDRDSRLAGHDVLEDLVDVGLG